MGDPSLRALERAWQQNPDDVQALQRLIAAKRRGGEVLPGWMLERELKPARRFESRLAFTVHAERVDGEIVEVGATPGELELPEHQAWWVAPRAVGKAWPAIVEELRAQQVAGLRLDRSQVTDAHIEALAQMPHLTALSLAACTRVTDQALRRIADNLPGLRRLSLDHAARAISADGIDALAGLPELVHLGLRDRGDDGWIERLTRVAPRLTQLRIGGKQVTNEGLRHAAGLRELTRLELFACSRASKAGLQALAEGGAPITHLELVACTRLKGSALGVLSRLPRLTALAFYPVGAWGQAAELEDDEVATLSKLRRLKRLALAADSAPPAARRALKRALPDTVLEFPEDTRAYWDRAADFATQQ